MKSIHLFTYGTSSGRDFYHNDAQTKIAAYCRILPPGSKYNEASIGRVLTTADFRKKGLGKDMIILAINTIKRQYQQSSAKISAQSYLERFYSTLGFKTVSEPYFDGAIPHIDMLYSEET